MTDDAFDVPEPDVAVQGLRRYFGLYPGIVRAEIKAPHVFFLEEPINSYVPSSLDDVTDTEEALAEVVESFSKVLEEVGGRPVSHIIQPFKALGDKIETLNKPLDSVFEGVFETLREIDFQEVNDKMLSAGRELGERGWLVGPLMTAQGLFQVLEDTDSIMKERYPVEHLIGLVEQPDDFQWQKMILEAIQSYRDERYGVVILSLFPVIEALIRERADGVDADGGHISEVNKRVYVETETRAREEFHLLAAREASILGFVEARWEDSPNMLSDDPSELSNINRHWAVHGKDDPGRWNPIDAHRLLQVAAVLAHEKRYLSAADEN